MKCTEKGRKLKVVKTQEEHETHVENFCRMSTQDVKIGWTIGRSHKWICLILMSIKTSRKMGRLKHKNKQNEKEMKEKREKRKKKT